MRPYNRRQYWDANVPPAQQQQQSAHHPSPSHQQLAQYPPPPRPPYYYAGNQQQYWNAYMLPPAQQQQQLAHHPSPSHQQFAQYPPPPRPPYYYDGGNQQQYWNSDMLPPAQQQQPLGHYPPPSHQQSAQYPSPPQQPHHYGDGAAGNVGGADEVRSRILYIGSLEDWMDEDYLNSCFGGTEQLVSAEIIRRKQTRHEGYGFLEFTSCAAAEDILQSFNGKQMPYAEQSFKLDWASPIAEYFFIFVGNLDVSVTDRVLREAFKSEYPSVKSAKVKRDRGTAGRSKGYGFVKFGDETEKNRSIVEMNGRHISNKPITVSDAFGKTPSSAQPQNASHQNPQGASDPNNTSIYVEGLPFDAPDWELRRVFSQFVK